MNTLDFALRYASKGKPVFPCREIDNGEYKIKSPYISGGFKNATTDPEQIKKWWTEYPNALIGIPTGKSSNLAIVDLDLKKGKDGISEWDKLCNRCNEQIDTFTVETPTGGRHLYFSYREGFKNSTDKIGIGIDTRGDGGYIIAPNSVINGKKYQIIFDKKLADIPDWVMDLLNPARENNSPDLDNSLIQKETSEQDIREALNYINPDCSYQDWINIGMALANWNYSSGLTIWDNWSSTGSKYKNGICQAKWDSFKTNGGITVATLFDMAKKNGYRKVFQQNTSYKEKEQKKEEPILWERPLPLCEDAILNEPFPIELLPIPLRDMAVAMQNTMNIPLSMGGGLVLRLNSIALRKKFRVIIKEDHKQFGNLYLMPVVPVAGAKTPGLNACKNSFIAKQEEYKESYNSSLKDYVSKKKAYNFEISKIEKGKDNLEVKIKRIRELIDKIGDEPLEKILLCENATSEALELALFQSGESIGIMSSEGRTILENIEGKYNSTGGVDCGIFLKGHAGDFHRTNRINRKGFTLQQPIIASVVMLQPDALETAGEYRGLRDSGFLARWLYVYTDINQSDYPIENIPLNVKNNFNNLITKILDLSDGIIRDVKLSPEAFDYWKKYHDQLKRKILENQLILSPLLTQCLNKLPEHIARIALNLHVADMLTVGQENYILESDTMRRAILLGEFFRKHINKAVRAIGENENITHARKIFAWISNKREWLKIEREKEGLGKIEALKIKDIQQQEVSGLKEKDKIESILEVLEEYGYLQKGKITIKENTRAHSFFYIIPKEVLS